MYYDHNTYLCFGRRKHISVCRTHMSVCRAHLSVCRTHYLHVGHASRLDGHTNICARHANICVSDTQICAPDTHVFVPHANMFFGRSAKSYRPPSPLRVVNNAGISANISDNGNVIFSACPLPIFPHPSHLRHGRCGFSEWHAKTLLNDMFYERFDCLPRVLLNDQSNIHCC